MGIGAVGVTVLLGELPPDYVDEDVIRSLRDKGGNLACSEGLRLALDFIGKRRLPITAELIEAARKEIGDDNIEWAIGALWMRGSNFAYGFGYGYGSGSGYGYGYGSGAASSGYGYGSGSGYGYGYGSGAASGYGSGYGFGYGFGYGSGDGSGDDL